MPSPTRDRRILWNRQGINYLLLDRFTTAATAPLASPRNAEPGPGTLAITDPENKLNVASGALQWAKYVSAGNASFIRSSASFARTAGRALFGTVTLTQDGQFNLTLDTATTLPGSGSGQIQLRCQGGGVAIRCITNSSSNNNLGDLWPAVSTAVPFALVMRGTGAFFLLQLSGTWKLAWVGEAGNSSPLYALWSNSGSQAICSAGTLDDFRIVDLGGVWASDYGIATSYKATTANNDTGTSLADAFIEHTITAQTGVTQELSVRYTDDNNRWIVRCDQGGSTVALIERNAGVETSRGSAAQTWTNGTQYRIMVYQEGTSMRVYVTNTSKLTYNAGNNFNITATGVKVSHAGATLACWPRVLTLPAV